MTEMKLLNKDFFRRDVLCVAPDLTGRVLVRRLDDGTLLRLRITETEAYRGEATRAAAAQSARRRSIATAGRSTSISATECTGC